ncbi:uncharacterized protein LOC127879578 isoform X2 [Dreissena polymorpha]|uniref:Uncharacterized protein n=1 Tax=Dreissena polymorpha TaxID=45954 RepID=A0A9D4K0W1_DREPO|nr:uncharacterized protein LOC127879578 isoform X2 [Dreissena polymorpha]KAH3830886.1 hypothetical protein DPMN_104142 [Dreissena polymorpha]
MKTKKKSREESNSSKSGKDAKCKVDRFVCHSHVGKPPLPKQDLPPVCFTPTGVFHLGGAAAGATSGCGPETGADAASGTGAVSAAFLLRHLDLCSFTGAGSTAARIPRPSLRLFRYGLPNPSSHATTSTRHGRFTCYGCVNTSFSFKAISQKERDRWSTSIYTVLVTSDSHY